MYNFTFTGCGWRIIWEAGKVTYLIIEDFWKNRVFCIAAVTEKGGPCYRNYKSRRFEKIPAEYCNEYSPVRFFFASVLDGF